MDFSTRGARETGMPGVSSVVGGVFNRIVKTAEDVGTSVTGIVNFGPQNSGLASNADGATALSQTGAPEYSNANGWIGVLVLAFFGIWFISRIK